VRCSRCGRDNPESLRFCQDCGSRLQNEPQPNEPVRTERAGASPAIIGRPEAPAFGFTTRLEKTRSHCGHCGYPVTVGNSFCPECGTSLSAESSLISAVARSSLPPQPTGGVTTSHTAVNSTSSVPAPHQQKNTLRCPRCRKLNVSQATSCSDCGTQLIDVPVEKRASLPNPNERANETDVPVDSNGVRNTLSPQADEQSSLSHPVRPDGSSPSLVVIGQDGSEGRVYSLANGQTDIGRSEGDIILPDDRFVCSRHARFIRSGSKVSVQDLNSVNGVYKRVRGPSPLLSGDTLLLGLAVLRFEVLAPGEQILNSAVERGTQLFGTPSGPRYARLSEKTVEGVSRNVFVINREETILGREVGDIVFSSDPFMSRRHAAITRNPNDGSFSVVDLGSSNGTFLRIRGQAELVFGDHLRIGQHLFRYDYEDDQGQAKAR
jgi:pSer/pThr/pTyr-binding forkhead associated (FHA) protein/rRNA maturation endonuclease Nob1